MLRALRTSLICTLALCCLGPLASARALEPDRLASQYVARTWTTADGLPDPAVRSVIQTRDGYLWLGTHGGLARFDGRRFVVFNRANSGLGHDHVLALSEDAQGRIWIGTEEGLYRLEGGIVSTLEAFGSTRVLALARDREGAIWVASERGLERVIPDGSITLYGQDRGLPAGLVHTIDTDGPQLIVGSGSGVFRLAENRFERLPEAGDGMVRAILQTRAGTLWLANTEAIIEMVDDKVVRRIPVRWESQQVWDLLEDRHGGIWSASYGAGIQRISGEGFDTVTLGTGYAANRPWRLLEDREGNLFVGTREGLIRLRDGPVIAWSVNEGLAAAHSRGVFADADGGIWVAHVAGITQIKGHQVRNYGRSDGLPADVHRAILRDHNGILWVGGEGGLSRFDGARFSALSRADGLPSDNVKVAINGHDGRIWTGHVGGVGVVRSGRAQSPKEFSVLADASVEAMLETRDQSLYVGTLEHGLWRWRDGLLEEIRLEDGKSRNGVRALHEDSEGRLWIGTTARGLFVQAGAHQHRIGALQGFPINGVWSIIDDGRGQWWFSSDTGIWRFAAADFESLLDGRSTKIAPNLRLTERDGMKSRECNGGGSPAAMLDADGRLWVATAGGVVSVSVASTGTSEGVGTAFVEAVRVGETALTSDNETGAYATAERSLTIDYTNLHFADPEALRFRYRLIGQDTHWTDAAERRTAYYTNLAPGEYRFDIASRLADQPHWTPGQGVTLAITPHWHERTSVRVATALAFFGLIALLLQRRLTAQRRTALELGRQVELRTAELRAANAELARIATIDSLTGLATPRAFRDHLATCVGPDAAAGPIALLLVDVDDFKLYNDSFGHLAGDDCLRRVASVLNNCARREFAFAARYGGEEFALLLAPGHLSRAITVAELLRLEIEHLGIASGAGARHAQITISVGIAHGPGNSMSSETLLQDADAALYAAKRRGRNRVEWTAEPTS